MKGEFPVEGFTPSPHHPFTPSDMFPTPNTTTGEQS